MGPRLGIERSFLTLNLTALRTRDQLREAARIRTGLPAYDQQVEGASSAPSALIAELRPPPTPAPRRSQPSAPAPAPAPTAPPPQTTHPDPNQANSPNNPPASFVAP